MPAARKSAPAPAPEEPEKPEIKESYRIGRQHLQKMQGGKQHLTWPGLLDLAHNYISPNGKENPVRKIETTIIQLPTSENNNTCVCQATVTMADGSTFSGIGDANPTNVGKMVAPHLIRMAETRSKGRALRDAVNVGEAIEEEMGGNEPTFIPANPLHTQLRTIWAEGGEKKVKVRQYILDNVPPGTAITGFDDLRALDDTLLRRAIEAGNA